MQREQLEHVIRAAAAISGQKRIVVIGSQAILAHHGAVPPAMLQSPEADLYPYDAPDLATVIDGAIGPGSLFQETFGYHADGVGPETAKLPQGWEARALTLTPAGSDAIGICPEPNDLAVSKLVSGRDKDVSWIQAGLDGGVFDAQKIAVRLDEVTGLDTEVYRLARSRLAAMCATD